MDKYIETLNKLLIKGMISEEERDQKIEEWNKKKESDFDTMVRSCIDEAVTNGQIGEMIKRIGRQKSGNK